MNTKKYKKFHPLSAIAFILALGSVPPALASSYYWDTTTTGLWTTGSNWSTSSTGSPAGTVAPSSSITADSAVFNGSSVNGNETIQLSAATSIAGITFNNTGTTTIASTTVAEQKITIGAGGITMAANAGNVTFDTVNKAAVTIGANQTWLNNNAAATLGGSTGIIIGGNTLTLAGAGNFSLVPNMTATSGGVLNANQTGTLTLGAASAGFVGTLNTGLNGGALLLNNSSVLTGAGALVNIQGGTIATSSTSGRILVANTSVSNDFTLGQAATGTGVVTISGAMDLNNATRQITTANSADTLSGVISNGGLTKAGIGTLTLSGTGANTYTGLTTVGAGGLTLSKTSVDAIAGSVLVNGTGTLTLGATDQIINTSNVEVATGGTFALATFTDTVNGVKLTGGTITGSAGGILTSTTAYDFQSSGNVTGSLAGTAGANKTTSGTVTFSGSNANTYTGLTTVSAGSLILGRTAGVDALASNVLVNGAGTFTITNSNQIKDTASVEVATGGTFGIAGNSETVNGLKLTGGSITGTTGVLTSTTVYDFQSGSSTAIFAGTAGANKTSTGTVTFSGSNANTYTGLTTVSAGTLSIGKATGVDSLAGDVLVNGTGTLTITNPDQIKNTANVEVATGGTFGIGGNSETVNGLKLTGGATTGTSGVLTSTTTIDFQSGNSGAKLGGTAGATKTATGTVSLSGASTYSGGTTLTAGTLQIGTGNTGSVGAITDSAIGTGALALNGGTLSSSGTIARTILNAVTIGGDVTLGNATTTGALTFSANADIGSSTRTLTTASAVTFSGNVTGTGGISKMGSGALTYNGTTANTYSGLTTVSAGSLTLTKTATVDAIAGDVLVNGTLNLGASDQIKNTSNVELATGGTFSMGAFNEAVNGLKLTGGSITGGASGAPVTLTVGTSIDLQSGSATSANLVLAGTAGATKTTTGTVTLSGANTYTGTTTLNAGTLQIGVNSAALVGVVTSGALGTGTLALNGGKLSSASVTGRSLLNATTVGGNVTLGDTANTGALTFSAGVDLGNSVRTLTTESAVTLDGVVTNGGIIKDGSSSLKLTTLNTYSSGTTLTAGTLLISASSSGAVGAVTSGPVGTGTLALNGGTFSSSGTFARTILNAVTIGGDVTLGNGASTGALTFNAATDLVGNTRTLTTATDVIFNGVVSNGGINKAGASNLTLGGANTYTGTTTINEGTLAVNGSLYNSGSVVVNANGLLGGSGSVGAISGSGTVGPGNSPGILTATSVNPTAGTDFKFEFTSLNPTYSNATASVNDLLRLTASSSPFAGGTFTSENIISIYLNSETINDSLLAGPSTTFRGGFFVDGTYGLAEALNTASFAYYTTSALLGTAGSSAVDYNGTSYYALANTAVKITLSNTAVTDAGFATGAASGTLLTFNAVPEPSTGALLGFGLGGLVLTRLLRRK